MGHAPGQQIGHPRFGDPGLHERAVLDGGVVEKRECVHDELAPICPELVQGPARVALVEKRAEKVLDRVGLAAERAHLPTP